MRHSMMVRWGLSSATCGHLTVSRHTGQVQSRTRSAPEAQTRTLFAMGPWRVHVARDLLASFNLTPIGAEGWGP